MCIPTILSLIFEIVLNTIIQYLKYIFNLNVKILLKLRSKFSVGKCLIRYSIVLELVTIMIIIRVPTYKTRELYLFHQRSLQNVYK